MTTSRSPSPRSLLPYVVLSLIAVVPYLPCLNNEFVEWDDHKNIYDVSTFRQSDPLKRIWFSFEMPSYLPVTDTFWYAEGKIWGVKPGSARYFHAVSIALHAINVLLVCLVVRKLGFDFSTAWFVAALFAVHPWRVENVAWATEQKSLLSGIFVWLSWLGYLQTMRCDKFMKRPYIISIIMFLMSLLSKPTAVAMPFIFLLGDWFQGYRLSTKKYLKIMPYLCISAILGAATIVKELYLSSQGLNISLIERMLLAGRTAGYYVTHFFFPIKIAPLYPRWNISAALPLNWLCFIIVAVITIALIRFSLNKEHKLMSLCTAGYLLLLMPVSGLMNMSYLSISFVADRYMYLPLFFLLLGMVQIFINIQKKITIRKKPGFIFQWKIFAVMLILFWSILTIRALPIWHDSITIWKYSIDASNHPVAHYNLAVVLNRQGKTGEAIKHYYEALRVNPYYVNAHYNLAVALTEQGKLNEAAKHFKKVFIHYSEVIRDRPNSTNAYYILGKILFMQGKLGEAIERYSEVIRIKPDHAEAHNHLGIALSKQERFDEAIEHYSKALRIKPNYEDAHYNMGIDLFNSGQSQKALSYFSQAHKLYSKKLGENHPYTKDSMRQIENIRKKKYTPSN